MTNIYPNQSDQNERKQGDRLLHSHHFLWYILYFTHSPSVSAWLPPTHLWFCVGLEDVTEYDPNLLSDPQWPCGKHKRVLVFASYMVRRVFIHQVYATLKKSGKYPTAVRKWYVVFVQRLQPHFDFLILRNGSKRSRMKNWRRARQRGIKMRRQKYRGESRREDYRALRAE